MGAAECARRTGLTVRTLRVYERHGLIEPMRSSNGWRCYGPAELQRLNVIVTLKTFGMTLEQIRAQLATKSPPLASVLEMQLQSCSARRDAADKAVGLIRTALATIKSGEELSLQSLCDLTRSMDMDDMFSRMPLARELLNEMITPEEERAVMTWIASRPSAEIKAMSEAADAIQGVRQSIQDLQQADADPAGPEAQALAAREKDISVRHGLYKFRASMFEWNAPLSGKMLKVSERAGWARKTSDGAPMMPDEELAAYARAVRAASPWNRALEPVVDEAAGLADKKAQPSAAPAQALAARAGQICVDHALGDPLIYVRWARAMQSQYRAGELARKQAGWTFLVDAIGATAGH